MLSAPGQAAPSIASRSNTHATSGITRGQSKASREMYAFGQEPRPFRLSVGARVHAAAAAFGCLLAFQFDGRSGSAQTRIA
jgi:hypothetical protein